MNDKENRQYLVVIETQKVKSYLFASPIMRETRGASVLLDLLNRKETDLILAGFPPDSHEKIYLGGGSGRILFTDRTLAEDFKARVLAKYRQVTVNSRVAVEIEERRDEDKEFAKWMGRGVSKARQNKLGRREGVPLLAGRWIRPCTSCGQEPAEEMLSEHGEHRLCRACWLKREEIRKHLYRKIKSGEVEPRRVLQTPADLVIRYTDKFIYTTLAQYNKDGKFPDGRTDLKIVLPQDFDDIGRVSRPANYMGFIYADGDRMGEVVKNMPGLFKEEKEAKRAYRAFSKIMDQATREAAVEAVLETVALEPVKTKHGSARYIPAEFVMAGGDDLMLVVPAHNALDVAIKFIEKFQDKTVKLQKQYVEDGKLSRPFTGCGLTTSAGVVLSHAHYPASDLMTLAAELMKLAKKKSAELARKQKEGANGEETGALDFVVISEAGSEPVKKRRQREYKTRTASGIRVVRTERPYTAAEARRLLATIRGLQDSHVPRSKLKALYPALFQHPLQAQFEALRIRERLKVTGDLDKNPVLSNLVMEYLHNFPYRKNEDGKWVTPLTEIIELYDFVQPL